MPDRTFSSAAILGTGSFGTALARLLASKLERVEMIGRDAAVAESINATHHNPRYLAGVELPENITASISLTNAAAHPLVLFCVPTAATRETAKHLAEAGLPESAVLL